MYKLEVFFFFIEDRNWKVQLNFLNGQMLDVSLLQCGWVLMNYQICQLSEVGIQGFMVLLFCIFGVFVCLLGWKEQGCNLINDQNVFNVDRFFVINFEFELKYFCLIIRHFLEF